MANVTRSFSVPVWRYGIPHADLKQKELYEVGMRVDATVNVSLRTVDGAIASFEALKATLGLWLQEHWAHRLLIGQGDAEALAFAVQHRTQIGRPFVYLDGAFEAEALAPYVFAMLRKQRGLNDARSVKVSLDPGGSYIVQANAEGDGCTGEAVCGSAGLNQTHGFTRTTTKYPLIPTPLRPQPSGAS